MQVDRSAPAIVDYSITCALGCTRAEVRAGLEASVPRTVQAFELPYAAPCGRVPGELAPLPPSLRDRDTRQARLAMQALEPLRPAIAAAIARHGAARVGLVLGSTNAGLDATERAAGEAVRGGSPPDASFLRGRHSFGAVLELLADQTGISGPATFVSTACSSSGKAFASAARMMCAGWIDAAVVGGIDALCEMTVRGFHSLSVLSEQPCKPFSAQRLGIHIGEGAAMFLIERDGEAPFALLGAGESADAHHMTAPDEHGAGAERAMVAALTQAGLRPADIDLVNAHGTGTAQGDASEARAIARALDAGVPVLSTKGYTGHALGAAGALEAALCMMSLEDGYVPASLGCEPLDPDLAQIDVVQTPRTFDVERVMSNSFGFGGTNVSLILGRRA